MVQCTTKSVCGFSPTNLGARLCLAAQPEGTRVAIATLCPAKTAGLYDLKRLSRRGTGGRATAMRPWGGTREMGRNLSGVLCLLNPERFWLTKPWCRNAEVKEVRRFFRRRLAARLTNSRATRVPKAAHRSML